MKNSHLIRTLIFVFVAVVFSACASTYDSSLTDNEFIEGVRRESANAKKTIAPSEQKITAGSGLLLAPVIQTFEFDEYGPEDNPDLYATWRAEAKSSDFNQIQRDLYAKIFDRLKKSNISVLRTPINHGPITSLGIPPRNPAGKEQFKFKPVTISSDGYELTPENTDAIKAATGASSVVFVAMHSIWSRGQFIELYGHTIQYNMNQWLRITVCNSSSNCATSYVPQDNSRFAMWIPVPFFNNGNRGVRSDGDAFARRIYTDGVSDVIDAAIRELLQ